MRIPGKTAAALLWLTAASLGGPVPGPSQDRFRTDADLVLIPVTVIDREEHFVTSLTQGDFALLDKGKPRNIVSFALEDTPVSAVVVLDLSGSMRNALPHAISALREFVENSNPNDEFALVTLRDRPKLKVNFTHDPDKLTRGLDIAAARGTTALIDAIYLAAQVAKSGTNPRRMVLVISDGDDNHSRYTQDELLRLLAEADVTVYTLGLPLERSPSDQGNQPGTSLLEEVAAATGGRYFEAFEPKKFPELLRKLDIRFVYVLGIRPATDGKYHRVELRLVRQPGMPRMHAHWRPGYYAPEQ